MLICSARELTLPEQVFPIGLPFCTMTDDGNFLPIEVEGDEPPSRHVQYSDERRRNGRKQGFHFDQCFLQCEKCVTTFIPTGHSVKETRATDAELVAALTAYVNEEECIMSGTGRARKPSLRKAAGVFLEHNNIFMLTQAFAKIDKGINVDEVGCMPVAEAAAEMKKLRLYAIAGLVRATLGNPIFLEQKFFSRDELDIISAQVKAYAQLGWPFEFLTFQEHCRELARARLRSSGDRWVDEIVPNGDVPVFGKGFHSRFHIFLCEQTMNHHNLSINATNARALQVSCSTTT